MCPQYCTIEVTVHQDYSCIGICYCRDKAELTQQVNRLDNQLNLLSEQNEALCERCGLGSEDAVDVGPLRSKKKAELEQHERDNHNLRLQVGNVIGLGLPEQAGNGMVATYIWDW